LEVISHWEYLAALKEGTGNLSLAVLIVLGTRWWVPGGVRGASMVVLLIFAFLLWSAQLLLAKRQARFEITVLARAGLLSPEETLAMGQHLGLKREQIPTGFRERRRA
jgi:hypothetical protein